MKLTDALISALMKRGILYEARQVDIEFTFPNKDIEGIKIRIKADHMTIQLEKATDK